MPDPEGHGPEMRRAWAEMFRKEAGLYERSAATSGRWKAIYERAARYPWVPFEADPYWLDRPCPIDEEPFPAWPTHHVPFWER
jgi:hypothetical protein